MADVYLTEYLQIDVQDTCGDGLYLRWINDLGGIDTWYFSGNIAELPQVENVQYFEKFVDNLLNERENTRVLSKEYRENIKCYTTFKKENSEGMKQLLRSRCIQMLVLSEWYLVDVVAESFTVEKHGGFGKMAIQIVLPKKYIK